MNYLNIHDYKNSGYIYIASYDGHPNTLKIGLTKNCPVKRIKSMNDSTYTIGTFHLVESYRTANVHDVEKLIHEALADKKLRKEFFSVSIDEAKSVISSFIMLEDFSQSDALVENCIHLIDYNAAKSGIPTVKELAVIEYKKAKFYILSPERMKDLLDAESRANMHLDALRRVASGELSADDLINLD